MIGKPGQLRQGGRAVGQTTGRSVMNESCLRWYVEYTVEQNPHMETIQVVLDKKLLLAADQAARRTKRNRSALMRDALREHLQRLELKDREARDRAGYARQPQKRHEVLPWERDAAWPAE